MGKDRIDLNNLLEKYQTGNKFYPANTASRQKYDVQQQFYGRKANMASNLFINQNKNQQFLVPTNNNNNNYQRAFENVIDQNVNFNTKTKNNFHNKYVGNFKMSKQQCRSFLESIGHILESQKNSYQGYPQHVLVQIKRQFQIQHQKIRRQILQTLDHAFKQNYRKIQQQLNRHTTVNPVQFRNVNQHIQETQRQIIQFIKKLNSNDDFMYRQAISKVVLKDYTSVIQQIKNEVIVAKQQYKSGLGQVQPDRTRIQCLKNDLEHLFYFRKKDAKVVQMALFKVLGGSNFNQVQSNSPTKNYNGNFDAINKQASRTRKSFFNFGN